MSRELLRRALNALDRSAIDDYGALKDALRAALAQPPIDGFGGNLDSAFDVPAVREPLTDEQIIDIRRHCASRGGYPWEDSITFARAIERHHGIGGGNG